MKRTLLPTALMLVAGAMALRAGQNTAAPPSQPPTFRAEVEYVEVAALVTDAQGHVVRNLTKDDFQVFEDRKPQAISAFSFVDIPIERYEHPLVSAQPEPDVRTNARPFDGRMYVTVIDDRHIDVLSSQLVKNAAKQFIERHFGANDLMAVVHTFGPAEASQEFTNNRRLLAAAVDRTIGQKLASATLSRNEEYARMRDINPGPVADPVDSERGFHARSTLTFLRKVSDWFAGVHGRRKSILFVSEGIDYDITDVFVNRQASTIIDETREVIASATRAGVSIYGIDPRGMVAMGDASIGSFADADSGSGSDGSSVSGANYVNPNTNPGVVLPSQIGMRSLMSELRLSQDSLRMLSDETGGFAIVNRNQFGDAYQRIVEDNSSYYVLAYYPGNSKRDGKYHKIDVRVTRPGLTVRARKGWVAPKGKAPAPAKSSPIRDALNSPIPVSGLTIQLFAVPFKGTAPNASVLIGTELLGRDMKLADNDKVELSFVAIDAKEKVHSRTEVLTLNLKPETKALVEQTSLRLLTRMELPPGRYQLRGAAHEHAGNATGSVLYDLEVPDFSKGPLAMSGIALTSAASSAIPTARPDEQLRTALPAPPTGVRTFSQADEIALFAELYDSVPGLPQKVTLTTTITSEDGRVVFRTEDDVRDSFGQGKPGSHGYTTRISLKDLAPGSYVLKVAAQARLRQEAIVDRQVPITIVSGSPQQ